MVALIYFCTAAGSGNAAAIFLYVSGFGIYGTADDVCQNGLTEVQRLALSAFILGSINLCSESKNERFIPPVPRRHTQTFMSAESADRA